MRPSSQALVNKIHSTYGLKTPAVDIGGVGSPQWPIPVDILDPNGGTITDDATNMIHVSSDYYETVITTDCFEHIDRPWLAIDEIYRIMKKDGILVLATVFVWGYHKHPEDYWRFTVPGLETLCRKFEKIESGWQTENVPITENQKIELSDAGVYFVGRKK